MVEHRFNCMSYIIHNQYRVHSGVFATVFCESFHSTIEPVLRDRGVPIIGSATISATDMAFLPISVSVQNSRRTDIATDIYTVAIVCT